MIGLGISIVSQLRFGGIDYAVAGFNPALVSDFEAEYYRTGGTVTTFESAMTTTRASSATKVDSSGNLLTVGTNVPRRGHHVWDGAAWVNRGMLVEPTAATNQFLYSSEFDNSVWLSPATPATITPNTDTSPDGNLTADRVQLDVGATQVLFQSVTGITPSSNYVFSFWCKNNGGTKAAYRVFDNTNKVNIFGETSYFSSINGSTYTRVLIPFTAPVGCNQVFVYPAFQGSASDMDVFLWGAQLEEGSVPTSYIPTVGATVTRAADIVTVPAANLPYDATNMSIQLDGLMTYADTAAGTEATFVRWYADASNYIQNTLYAAGADTGQIRVQQVSAGVSDLVLGPNTSYSPSINVPFNIASRHGSTFINGAVDGVSLTADLTPTALPNLVTTDLQLSQSGGPMIISKFRMWSDDLTDVGIAEASA